MSRKRRVNPLTEALNHCRSGISKEGTYVQYVNEVVGEGLFAKTHYTDGEFIAQYKGTLLTYEEACRTEVAYDEKERSFLYYFQFNGKSYCVDASCDPFMVNNARMANDAWEPASENAKMKIVFDLDTGPNLCLFAKKDICPGDEIRYNYGGENLPWRPQKRATKKEREADPDVEEDPNLPAPLNDSKPSPCDLGEDDLAALPGDDISKCFQESETIPNVEEDPKLLAPTNDSKPPPCDPGRDDLVILPGDDIKCFQDELMFSDESDDLSDSDPNDLPYVLDSEMGTDSDSDSVQIHDINPTPQGKAATGQGCESVGETVGEPSSISDNSSLTLDSQKNCELRAEKEPEETLCEWRSHNKKLQDDLLIRDKKDPGIYIRSSAKSSEGKTVYNHYHCCHVCHTLVSNIKIHWRKHKEEDSLKELFQLEKEVAEEENSEVKKQKQKQVTDRHALLRSKGDHAHNLGVMRSKKGELILSRRSNTLRAEEYGPCPLCFEWIKIESSSTKHQLTCPVSASRLTKGEAIVRSACLSGKILQEASKTLINEVFVIMKRDKITDIAQDDPLIIALGNSWWRRNVGNKLKRKNYTSARMRGAARLLENLREITGKTEAIDHFLKPECFDALAEAAHKCCIQAADDEEDLKHPSAAIKAGHDIGILTNMKLSLAVKTGDQARRAEASDVLTLLKLEWTEKVTKLVHNLLNNRRMLNSIHLPLPEDLAKLSNHLKSELRKLDLDDAPNLPTFRQGVKLAQTRLLVYNKRRSGELEAMPLENYHSRSKGLDPADEGLMGTQLTDLERFLVTSQEMIKIRGKVSRIVPVLVPDDVQEALAYITKTDVREKCGIASDNKYVFANTGRGVQRAYDSLKACCASADLTSPERITSVSLRKYMATITQVIDLKDHELEWVCNHLGHTANVHKIHYRSTSGYIERVNLGKLMLLQDYNAAGKFAGRQLKDVTVQELMSAADTTEGTESPELDDPGLAEDHGGEGDVEQPLKKRPKFTRRMWLREEEEEIKLLFHSNFTRNKCPRMDECMAAISRSRKANGHIYQRNWETIKKKVSHMLKKSGP